MRTYLAQQAKQAKQVEQVEQVEQVIVVSRLALRWAAKQP
jgi:hypothetical protein